MSSVLRPVQGTLVKTDNEVHADGGKMQLLGLQGRETNLQETHIMAAYEHLASSSLEQGYSKQVEDGRIVLLHAAVDGCRNLKNLALRSDRHSIAFQEAKTAMVQWWLLPAALSLLQEVSTCNSG